MRWENDSAFFAGARLVWPDDVALARAWHQTKGRAEARRIMQRRYEGWRLLVDLARLQSSCEHAAGMLRGAQ